MFYIGGLGINFFLGGGGGGANSQKKIMAQFTINRGAWHSDLPPKFRELNKKETIYLVLAYS